ncbi:CaiB/BaiF CoA transferase family protein [Glutamicibacter arilaitensis]|uniref:CaiB/BaiF CoA transferase family protein n=1 Tax=Glutamicibacter arilaitensis TaxID=256701 RepID=UPI003850D30B
MTHATRQGPLTGLSVLELGGLGPAPFAAMLLADLGADVLRVERSGAGFEMPVPERMDTLQRGKRRIRLDLKHEQGAETFLDLVQAADIVIDSYRPGVIERLGIGPDECLERNPRIIVARMTGWGQDGPLAQRAGHDPTYLALTGALHAIGRADGPPQLPLSLVGDFGGGAMYLVTGILAALWERERSGQGQVIDAAIVDGVSHLMASPYSLLAGGAWTDRRGENLIDSGAPFVDVYRTADDKWMTIAALEPPFFAELINGLGLDPAWAKRRWKKENWDQLRVELCEAFARRTRDEWEEIFAGRDACVAPVLSLNEAPESAHLQARGTFFQREEGHVEPAPAPRFSRTNTGIPTAAVGIDEKTASEALAGWGNQNCERLANSPAITKPAVTALN